jgi:hypothetical protein
MLDEPEARIVGLSGKARRDNMHEPANSILITQGLQNDFGKPIGPCDPLPNRLHVGFSEARRQLHFRTDDNYTSARERGV